MFFDSIRFTQFTTEPFINGDFIARQLVNFRKRWRTPTMEVICSAINHLFDSKPSFRVIDVSKVAD